MVYHLSYILDLLLHRGNRSAALADPLFHADHQVNGFKQVGVEQLALTLVGIQGQVLQHGVIGDAVGDQAAGDLIGAAEGQALFH